MNEVDFGALYDLEGALGFDRFTGGFGVGAGAATGAGFGAIVGITFFVTFPAGLASNFDVGAGALAAGVATGLSATGCPPST